MQVMAPQIGPDKTRQTSQPPRHVVRASTLFGSLLLTAILLRFYSKGVLTFWSTAGAVIVCVIMSLFWGALMSYVWSVTMGKPKSSRNADLPDTDDHDLTEKERKNR
jgi:hypothetical protein